MLQWPPRENRFRKVAIIGSGLSGLTVGATLSRAGHEVDVFEQYHRTGGVTAPFLRDGFRWDLGQLIVEGLGPDEPLGEILAKLGLQDKVKIRVEDRGYVFPDFSIEKPQQYRGARWRIEQLQERFPEDARGLDRYWADYLRFTSIMTLARRAERSEGLGALYQKLKLYLRLLPLLSKKDWSAQRLMDHSGSSCFRWDCTSHGLLACPSPLPGRGAVVRGRPIRERRWGKQCGSRCLQDGHADRQDRTAWLTGRRDLEPVRSYRFKTGQLSGVRPGPLWYNEFHPGAMPGNSILRRT